MEVFVIVEDVNVVVVADRDRRFEETCTIVDDRDVFEEHVGVVGVL